MPYYKLKKIKLKEGGDSIVWEGHEQQGHTLQLVDLEKAIRKQIDSIDDIEIGHQVLVTRGIYEYLITSPVTMIVQKLGNRIIFETETSIYELSSHDASELGYD